MLKDSEIKIPSMNPNNYDTVSGALGSSWEDMTASPYERWEDTKKSLEKDRDILKNILLFTDTNWGKFKYENLWDTWGEFKDFAKDYWSYDKANKERFEENTEKLKNEVLGIIFNQSKFDIKRNYLLEAKKGSKRAFEYFSEKNLKDMKRPYLAPLYAFSTTTAKYIKRGQENAAVAKVLSMMEKDLISNRFTCYIFFNGLPFLPRVGNPGNNQNVTTEGFAVRCTKVKIPHIISNTFNLKIAGTNINKVGSTKEISKKSSISFRMDQMYQWMRFFEHAAGTSDEISIQTKKKELKNFRGEIQYAVGKHNSNKKYNLNGEKGISLIVKMSDLSNDFIYGNTTGTNISIIFEDVRFLGLNDIAYSHDSQEPETQEIEFTYKSYWIFQGEGY